jgi:transcriptional regulator NrdR family protein
MNLLAFLLAVCQYVVMVCVYCSGPTGVTNSRSQKKNNQVWRRRRCKSCEAVFTTQETAQYDLAWRVQNGRRLQPFSGLKLSMSLYKSCAHRETALQDAQGLTETVIRKLAPLMRDGTVSSRDIAQVAQIALNRFDKAASVHYQAFHKGS